MIHYVVEMKNCYCVMRMGKKLSWVGLEFGKSEEVEVGL